MGLSTFYIIISFELVMRMCRGFPWIPINFEIESLIKIHISHMDYSPKERAIHGYPLNLVISFSFSLSFPILRGAPGLWKRKPKSMARCPKERRHRYLRVFLERWYQPGGWNTYEIEKPWDAMENHPLDMFFFFSGLQSRGGDLENEAVDLVWKPEFLIGKTELQKLSSLSCR